MTDDGAAGPVRRLLHDGWTARLLDGPAPDGFDRSPVPAQVPGSVHLDLMRAGRIPDPFDGANEQELLWLGRTSWRLHTEVDLDLPDAERHDLVLEGVDTLGTVRVNGVEVARTANQHRRYRIDVTDLVRAGRNRIEVDLAAALEHVEAEERRLGRRPGEYPHSFAMIRKAACAFGWDWGIEAVTCGLWRPVALESWSGTRIGAVRATARADGTATFAVDLERTRSAEGRPLEVVARIGDVEQRVTTTADEVSLDLALDAPDLWWPRTHGRPALHDATVEAGGDRRDLRVGFRTVTVDSEPDEYGRPFRLRVNGEPVFVRGANWIPADAFPTRVDGAVLDARLADAVDAGLNLLRVWGGGLYGSDELYDRCDALGLLVWQDLMFACAAYPEEEPLRSEVAAEVADVADRIASHPSLALWCGANENIWQHTSLGWDAELGGRTWGLGYYRDLAPGILDRLDPERVYIENSPFSWDPAHHPNDPDDGVTHVWDVWNQLDFRDYARWSPRFVGEFGFQGPPAWSTLTAAVHDEPLSPDGSQLAVHQKARFGQERIARWTARHLGRPTSMDDWHWAAQLVQADAIRSGIEHFRAQTDRCDGLVVWQLDDCWPVVSWSAVDSAGVRKPMWFALRDAVADRLLVLRADDLVVVNDSPDPWSGTVRVLATTLAGEQRAAWSTDLALAPRSATTVDLPPDLRRRERHGLRAVRAEGFRGTVQLDDEPVDRPPVRATCDVSTRATDEGHAVTVTARTPVLRLTLLPDRLDPAATVDDALVDLLPGERHTFQVATDHPLDPEALTRRPVLRTLDDLWPHRGPHPAP